MGDDRLTLALAGLGGRGLAVSAPGGGRDSSGGGGSRGAPPLSGGARAASLAENATPEESVRFLLGGEGGDAISTIMTMPMHEVLMAFGLPLSPGQHLREDLPLKAFAKLFACLIGRDLPLAERDPVGADGAAKLTEQDIYNLLLRRASELFFLFGKQPATPDDLMNAYVLAYRKAPYVTKRCAAMLAQLAPFMLKVQYSSEIIFKYIAGRNWATGARAQQDANNLLASLVLYLVLAYSGNNAVFDANKADAILKQALEAPEKLISEVLNGMYTNSKEDLRKLYYQMRVMPVQMGIWVMQLIFAYGSKMLSTPDSYKPAERARALGLRYRDTGDRDEMFLVSALLHYPQHHANGVPLSDFLTLVSRTRHYFFPVSNFLDAVVLDKLEQKDD